MQKLIPQFTLPLRQTVLSWVAVLLCIILPIPAFAVGDTISGFIYNLCIGFGGFFLWIGGMMLDFSIGLLVIGMGDLINNESGLGTAINQLWTVVRDILNILFIFGLIYIGFQTILNAGSTNTKKLVGMLVVAALLINFSLFAVKAVVDFSNIAAYQIYQLMDVTTEGSIYGEYSGISGAFMQFAKLQTYSNPNDARIDELAEGDGNIGNMQTIGLGFMVMFFLLVTAFVFIAGAILIMTRFIILVLLMIGSPLLLLGFIMPAFDGISKKYSKRLIDQALVAPAFLFMLYLSLILMQQLPTGESTIASALNQNTASNFFGLMIYVCLMIGLVVASLIVAKNLGAVGASQAMNIGNSLQKKVRVGLGNATIGGSAALGRITAGRWAQKAADSEALAEAASRGGMRGFAARTALKSSRAVGDASFDARRVGGIGKTLGIGEGSKGGYKSKRDAYVKSRQQFAESLGEVGDDDEVVKKYQAEVNQSELELQSLKLDKEAATSEADKKVIQQKIQATESALKAQKENVQREKARRQIGSVAFASKGTADKVSQLEKEQKEAFARFRNATSNTERESISKEITAKKKELASARKEMRKGGIANVYKNSSTLSSLFSGHMPDFDAEAGSEILKKYEKKFKETDEDKRSGAIIAALKESSKKEG